MALKLYHDSDKFSLNEFSILAGVMPSGMMEMETSLLLDVLGNNLLLKSEEFHSYKQRLMNMDI